MKSKTSWGEGGGGWTGAATPTCIQRGSRTTLLAAGGTAQGRESIFHSGCPEKSKYNVLLSLLHHAPSSNHRGEGKLTWLIFSLRRLWDPCLIHQKGSLLSLLGFLRTQVQLVRVQVGQCKCCQLHLVQQLSHSKQR